MPEQSLVGLFVVDGDAASDDPFPDDGEHIAKGLGLEHAVLAGDDPVGVGGVEAHDGVQVAVELDRELGLVAVAQRFVGAADGEDVHVQVSDALEGVRHTPVFIAKFRLVGHVPVAAPAALGRHRTVRLDPVFGGREHLERLADGVVLLRLDDVAEHRVSHRRIGYKNSDPLMPTDAAAFCGHGVDGEGDLVVLFQHSMVLPAGVCPRFVMSILSQIFLKENERPHVVGRGGKGLRKPPYFVEFRCPGWAMYPSAQIDKKNGFC